MGAGNLNHAIEAMPQTQSSIGRAAVQEKAPTASRRRVRSNPYIPGANCQLSPSATSYLSAHRSRTDPQKGNDCKKMQTSPQKSRPWTSHLGTTVKVAGIEWTRV